MEEINVLKNLVEKIEKKPLKELNSTELRMLNVCGKLPFKEKISCIKGFYEGMHFAVESIVGLIKERLPK